eukprot:500511_1
MAVSKEHDEPIPTLNRKINKITPKRDDKINICMEYMLYGYIRNIGSVSTCPLDIKYLITIYCGNIFLPIDKIVDIQNINQIICGSNFKIFVEEKYPKNNYYSILQNAKGIVSNARHKIDDLVINNVNGIRWVNKIKFNRNTKIMRCFASFASDNIFWITSKNELFANGFNKYGELGLLNNNSNTDIIYTPTPISYFNVNKLIIKEIKMGKYHSLILCNNNKVYSCGDGIDYGQNGHNKTWTKNKAFAVIKALSKHNIKAIGAGVEHSLFLTSTNKLYSCGNNKYGAVGHSNTNKIDIIPYFNKNNILINSLECGGYHNIVMDNNSILYSWGLNNFGQCGIRMNHNADNQNVLTPTTINCFKKMKIKLFKCGMNHNAVITSNNEYYVFGQNNSGECFIDPKQSKSVINMEHGCINEYILKETKAKNIISINLGNGLSCLLLSFPTPSIENHPRIHFQPNSYNQLMQLERHDIRTVYHDEKQSEKYLNLIEREIRKTKKHQKELLKYIEFYVAECLAELNLMKPQLTATCNYILNQVLPRLTELLLSSRPYKNSEFAFNYFFRLILVLCKKCIQVDIICFRLLEIIFGFDPKNKNVFYSNCGLPVNKTWTIEKYGDGEMLKKNELEQKIKDLESKLNKLNNNKAEIETIRKLEIELKSVDSELNQLYETSLIIGYASDNAYCGENESAKNISWFRMQNINYFAEIGGFDTIIKRISHTASPIDISDLINLLRPMAQLRDLFNPKYHKELVSSLYESVKTYFKQLPPLVIRQITTQSRDKLFKNIHFMMNNSYNTLEILQVKETLALQLAATQIRGPYAQCRIFGMNHINKIIEQSIKQDKLEESKNNNDIAKIWADTKYIERFFKQEHLLEFILNRSSSNMEFIKRIRPIYSLLIHNKTFNVNKHLLPLWELTKQTMNLMMKQEVFGDIGDIACYLDVNQLDELCELIRKTPDEQFDLYLLNLIKQISKNINLKKMKDSNKITDMLWRFLMSDIAYTMKERYSQQSVVYEALDAFTAILCYDDDDISQRNIYIKQCALNIQKSSKMIQSLQILQRLIGTFERGTNKKSKSRKKQKGYTQKSVIEQLENDYNIIDHLLGDFRVYKKKA